MYRSALVCLLLASVSPRVPADEWPHWRGPHRDGISRETNWLDHGREETLWSGNVGLGHSSFAIADGRVYTLGHDAERELDTVFCLDAETGKEIWTYSYPSAIWNDGHTGGTLTTPSIDGDVVYTSNREGRLFCFDAATGDIRWQRDLAEEFDLTPSHYGFAASPLVLDDMLIMNVDRTIALDKSSGEEIWRTEKLYGRAFSTPAAFEHLGEPRLAVFNGLGLVILDRANGLELASHPWSRRSPMNPATPIVLGDRIFISAGYREGCALLELDADDHLTPVWASRVMCNKVGTCVLIDGHLYGFDESMLKCIDLEGNEQWRVRGLGMGCLSAAGNRLIIMSSKGELIVAEASAEAFEERTRTKVLDGGTYWATPVISDGRIYCRNSEGDIIVRDHRPEAVVTVEGDSRGGEAEEEPAPEPDDLFARHRKKTGELAPGQIVHLSGTFERRAEGVIDNPMTLQWRAPDTWVFRFDHPWGGRHVGADAHGGWSLPAEGLAIPREDAELLGMLETAGIVRWFDSGRTWPEGEYAGQRTLQGRRCHVVRTVLADGRVRDLFFDVDTGLLRGRDGDSTPLVVYDDYQSFGDITLPTRMTIYQFGTGIMEQMVIRDVTVPHGDDASIAIPDAVRDMPRTAEQIAASDAEARRRWGGRLGHYAAGEGADEAEIYSVIIQLGHLALRAPSGNVFLLLEPDESGRWDVATIDGAAISFASTESGRATSLTIHQEGRDDAVLARLNDE